MIDTETATWLLETYAWLLHVPGERLARDRPLVTPTSKYFSCIRSGKREIPEHLLLSLQNATGTSAWKCRLQAQESFEADVVPDGIPIIPDEREPAGTFTRSTTSARAPELTYHPLLVSRPMALTAILAHGLSHIMLARCSEPPPGGERTWDYVTDLGAVFLGAGIFLANAAHEVAYEEGVHWEGPAVYCQGWLSESELSFALAVFAQAHGHPIRSIARYLRPSPRAYLRKASRRLRRDEHLKQLWRNTGLPGALS